MGRKGFSTIELIVVIILVGVIASIAFRACAMGSRSRTSAAPRR